MRKKIINLNEEFSINCNASMYSDIVLENYFQFLREFSSSNKVKLQSGIKKSTAIAKKQSIF